MPAIWGLAPTRSIEEDREVRLSTGAIVDLSTINLQLGLKPTRNQIQAIVDRVQASMDHIVPLASLPNDEPTKTMTTAELQAQYGGRVFLDGLNIVNRSTLFSLAWDNGQLVPRWEVVR